MAQRGGLSTCAWQARAGDEEVAVFTHPTWAWVHARDYQRIISQATGQRITLYAVPRQRRCP